MKHPEMTIEINADTTQVDLVIEKLKQLKSLVEEVKTLTASIDVCLTADGKPIFQDRQTSS